MERGIAGKWPAPAEPSARRRPWTRWCSSGTAGSPPAASAQHKSSAPS